MKKIPIIIFASFFSILLRAQSLIIEDTHNSNTSPSTYNQKFQPFFKYHASMGLPFGGSGYYSVLGFRGWSDNTGGKAHELAFGDNDNVYVRSGLDPSWANWRRFALHDENGNIKSNGLTVDKAIISSESDNIALSFMNQRSTIRFLYASFGETGSGASTILGNNVSAAGITNNAIIRTMSSADAGSFVKLNYIHGITFHTGVNSTVGQGVDDSNYEVMRISHQGYVGIGTSNPTAKLSVNGNIRAKEIKVEAAPWPDYVFHPSYKLPDLKATETFIKENNHLPGIPSAAEVEKEGVNLGEMNAKLLEKIEEVTLYLIEFKKEINEIRQENSVLKNKVSELQKTK